ncbi:MAG: YfhO family protein [Leptolyngbya sp.]|nr:YfhO family protein [Candidatus Melainabacteria bacterium]
MPNTHSTPEHHRHFKLVSETTPEMVRVYENTRALPPAYFVYETRLAKDISEACRVMTQHSYNPRKTASVESPEALLPERKDLTYDDVKVEFSRPDVNSVEIKLVNEIEGLLVVSETFFPGWTCTDNGKEITIYKTNGVMRGLKLSPGSHNLKMTYMPVGLKGGFILWAIGIFLAVFLLMKMRKTS